MKETLPTASFDRKAGGSYGRIHGIQIDTVNPNSVVLRFSSPHADGDSVFEIYLFSKDIAALAKVAATAVPAVSGPLAESTAIAVSTDIKRLALLRDTLKKAKSSSFGGERNAAEALLSHFSDE